MAISGWICNLLIKVSGDILKNCPPKIGPILALRLKWCEKPLDLLKSLINHQTIKFSGKMTSFSIYTFSHQNVKRTEILNFSYLQMNSVSVIQRTSHCSLLLTRPRFLAYLSIAKPLTFSKVQALSQGVPPAKHTFWI